MCDNAHQVLAACHKAQRLPSVASREPCVVCRDPLVPFLGRWTPPSGYACLCVSLRRIFECTTAEYQLIDWAPSRPPPGSVRGSSTPRGPTSPSGCGFDGARWAGAWRPQADGGGNSRLPGCGPPHHDTLALAGPEVPGSRLGTVRLPRVHPARGARTGLEAWLPPARVRDVKGSDAITVTVPCAVLRHWHHRVL